MSFIGILKTTTIVSYLFVSLWPHIMSIQSPKETRSGPTHFILGVTEAQRGKVIYFRSLSKLAGGGRISSLE